MAKDPAFLFYYQDFLVGTDDMSNEQIGAYIKCLCHQAHRGHITKDHMLNTCSNQAVFDVVVKKFESDTNGNFVNQRLNEEVDKRKRHSDLQKQRAEARWHKSGIDPAMPRQCLKENENEDEDETKDETENGKYVEPLFLELNQLLHSERPCKRSKEYFEKIRTRLKRYSSDEIVEAAKNMTNSSHMMGENDDNRKYATLEYITRNDKNVQKWLEQGQGKVTRLMENLDVK